MDLLKGAKSSRSRTKWGQEAQESFKWTKGALVKAILFLSRIQTGFILYLLMRVILEQVEFWLLMTI